jgi:hypothetical protein
MPSPDVASGQLLKRAITPKHTMSTIDQSPTGVVQVWQDREDGCHGRDPAGGGAAPARLRRSALHRLVGFIGVVLVE